MDQFEQTIEYLEAMLDNPDHTAGILSKLISSPITDRRIVPYLKELCEDTRLTTWGIPRSHSEVRYVAAYALQAHYGKLGIDEIVYLPGILKPMTNRKLGQVFYEEVEGGWPRLGMPLIEGYEILVRMGKVPTFDLKLTSHIKNRNK